MQAVRKCVPNRALCNGVDDSGDGTDEDAAVCAAFSCPRGQFTCADSYMCVPQGKVCDGNRDCRLAEDENQGCACEADQVACGAEVRGSALIQMCLFKF